MSAMIYGIMCIFDGAILAGTVYMIQVHNWSAWWMILAVAMISGSNPNLYKGK